jgi:hypothetical protein
MRRATPPEHGVGLSIREPQPEEDYDAGTFFFVPLVAYTLRRGTLR